MIGAVCYAPRYLWSSNCAGFQTKRAVELKHTNRYKLRYPYAWRGQKLSWLFSFGVWNLMTSSGPPLASDVFCTLSLLFVRLGFRLLCARLAAHSFTVYLVFNYKQTTTATAEMAVYACVTSLFISFPFVTWTTWKDHILRILKNVKYDGQFWKLLFQILTLSYIFCFKYQ